MCAVLKSEQPLQHARVAHKHFKNKSGTACSPHAMQARWASAAVPTHQVTCARGQGEAAGAQPDVGAAVPIKREPALAAKLSMRIHNAQAAADMDTHAARDITNQMHGGANVPTTDQGVAAFHADPGAAAVPQQAHGQAAQPVQHSQYVSPYTSGANTQGWTTQPSPAVHTASATLHAAEGRPSLATTGEAVTPPVLQQQTQHGNAAEAAATAPASAHAHAQETPTQQAVSDGIGDAGSAHQPLHERTAQAADAACALVHADGLQPEASLSHCMDAAHRPPSARLSDEPPRKQPCLAAGVHSLPQSGHGQQNGANVQSGAAASAGMPLDGTGPATSAQPAMQTAQAAAVHTAAHAAPHAAASAQPATAAQPNADARAAPGAACEARHPAAAQLQPMHVQPHPRASHVPAATATTIHSGLNAADEAMLLAGWSDDDDEAGAAQPSELMQAAGTVPCAALAHPLAHAQPVPAAASVLPVAMAQASATVHPAAHMQPAATTQAAAVLAAADQAMLLAGWSDDEPEGDCAQPAAPVQPAAPSANPQQAVAAARAGAPEPAATAAHDAGVVHPAPTICMLAQSTHEHYQGTQASASAGPVHGVMPAAHLAPVFAPQQQAHASSSEQCSTLTVHSAADSTSAQIQALQYGALQPHREAMAAACCLWLEHDLQRFTAVFVANGQYAGVAADAQRRTSALTAMHLVQEALSAAQNSQLVPFLGSQCLLPSGVLVVVWCAEDGTFWHGPTGISAGAPDDFAAEVSNASRAWCERLASSSVCSYLSSLHLVDALGAVLTGYGAAVQQIVAPPAQ